MKARLLHHRSLLILLVVAIGVTAIIWGCSGKDQNPVAPSTSSQGNLDAANPLVQSVMNVQNRHTKTLLAIPDVVGTATTLDDNGDPAIAVYVTTDAAMKAAPTNLEGVPVVLVYTDKIVPMKGGGGVSHTAPQTAPIQLGTSGGWRYDLANGFCCGGTLGSMVHIGSTQYVLSNYHVFAADIVSGGNSRVAAVGDPIIQPGLIDVNCNQNNAMNVATLANLGTLPDGNGGAVDACLAQVISGQVRSDGAILEVGTISASTVAASINQAVKKSGRTTGLSRSKVSALNGNFNIQYENECAGGNSFVQNYTNQIVISNSGSKFLAGGDSGSLMVEDVTTNPRAVGLLFAGSSTIAIANPIGQVLSAFGATMGP